MSVNNFGYRHINDLEHDKFDKFSRAITVIQEPHRMSHEGFMYHTSGKVTGMIDANVDDFLFVTPALTFPHLQRLEFTFGAGDIDIVAYEDTTTSADGALVTTHNTNRNSTNTPNLEIYQGPTVTGVGTLIHTQWVQPTSTGVGQTANGVSNVSNGEEWLLKPSTKYLIRVTNNSGATINYRFEALWYEIDWTKAGK